ncbi:hypothetical protein DYB35_006054 [Aphanomyces astaci]|uniref:FAD dependent oxidoreductase domain-containing protein n=1 Tax=Aphanomyces astaci TaxID=112090 RepID=A0A3R7EB27_APHAT|nr:hypothetical protein DYB35_006054 [Aphanomyces astaci]
MTQFGLFVNGHAEAVRDKLVKHKEGTQGLVVKAVGSLRTVDHGFLATQLVQQMTDHLVDPALNDWVLPSFSTTTDHDRVVGSVVMLAAAKKYFTYKSVLSCGIPSVTLHGSVSDWQEIRRRVATLSRFDHILTAKWQHMLEPVLDQFVAAANNTPDVGFWRRICHAVGGGSGPSYLSGWITLFSVFNDQGEWMGDPRTESVTMWRTSNVQGGAPAIEAHVETIGGDFVEMADVAPGYLTVDVTVIDHSVRFTTVLFAGHLAYKVEGKNAIQPTLAWAMALKPRESKSKAAACDQDSQAVNHEDRIFSTDQIMVAHVEEDDGVVADVAVIGGGVVGTAVFRELVLRGYNVTLLEKNANVVHGASCGNSGIACTGYDAPEGSLEVRTIYISTFNVESFALRSL